MKGGRVQEFSENNVIDIINTNYHELIKNFQQNECESESYNPSKFLYVYE